MRSSCQDVFTQGSFLSVALTDKPYRIELIIDWFGLPVGKRVRLVSVYASFQELCVCVLRVCLVLTHEYIYTLAGTGNDNAGCVPSFQLATTPEISVSQHPQSKSCTVSYFGDTYVLQHGCGRHISLGSPFKELDIIARNPIVRTTKRTPTEISSFTHLVSLKIGSEKQTIRH